MEHSSKNPSGSNLSVAIGGARNQRENTELLGNPGLGTPRILPPGAGKGESAGNG